MHFRERGHLIQVIRTTYNPETKKGKPEIVARLRADTLAINKDGRKNLSADEMREVEAWIAARKSGGGQASAAAPTDAATPPKRRGPASAPSALVTQLDEAFLWFRKNQPDAAGKELAAAVALRLQKLRGVLRRGGWVASAEPTKPAGT
jgi:hypothetical protein